MFAPTFTKLRGPDKTSDWQKLYNEAGTLLRESRPEDIKKTFTLSLEKWSNAGISIKSVPDYHDSEKYCLQQSHLWNLFNYYNQKSSTADIKRTIVNRAKKVINETPQEACPLDLSFLQGKSVTQKILDHLSAVHSFYSAKLTSSRSEPTPAVPSPTPVVPTQPAPAVPKPTPVAPAQPAPAVPKPTPVAPTQPAPAVPSQVVEALPISNDNFVCTWAIHTTDSTADARKWLAAFLQDGNKGRIITLGNDAASQKAANICDTLVEGSAGSIGEGRCLWIQNPTVLQDDLKAWLKGSFDPAQARCIFVRPSGAASDILKISEPTSAAVISNKWTLAHP